MATPRPTPIIKKEIDEKRTERLKTKTSAFVLRPRYPELRPKPDPAAIYDAATTQAANRQPILPRPALDLRNPYSGCLISPCRTRKCKLRTHHNWNTKKRSNEGDTIMSASTAAYVELEALKAPEAGLGVLLDLPIDILDGAEAKRLFHLFFSYDYPRHTALLHPPPALATTKHLIHVMRQSAAMKSVSSPVLCLQYISSAHLHELTRRNDSSPNRISRLLRGKLLQLLREELNNFHTIDGEAVILIILTIVQFDIALGQFIALNGHRNALQLLINRVGGVHRLEYAHQYVMNLDRILAIYTEQPPLYAEKLDRKFLRSPRLELRYGRGFEVAKEKLNLRFELFNFCFDICRAIEIVEHENWTFHPGRKLGSFDFSQIQYLYFFKHHIHNTFAHLQSDPSLQLDRSRPILFASNVVAYLVLQINFLPPVTLLLLRRLRSALKEQNLPKDWHGHENILRWIMCVLVMTPVYWDGRVWAQSCLIELLRAKYGFGDWPDGWINEQAENVRHFVWSSRLDGYLTKALYQLERSRFAQLKNRTMMET